MATSPFDFSDLRRFLVDMLDWVEDEPVGSSVVTNSVPLAEVGDDGIPWDEYPGRHDEILSAADQVRKLRSDPTPLLLLLQRRKDLADILPNAIVAIDALLAVFNESASIIAAPDHAPPRDDDSVTATDAGSTASPPSWNSDTSELSFGGQVIKSIKNVKQAKNILLVLNAFEDCEWKRCLKDPLPKSALTNSDPQRLKDTIASLNDKLTGIRFYGDGTGENVCWKPVK